VVLLVLADWLCGILAALRAGTFVLDALPKQVETTVLPYVGGMGVLAVLQGYAAHTTVGGPFAAAFTLAAASYIPKAALDITEKVGLILSGPLYALPPSTPHVTPEVPR
jgi:hypothetical protein